MHQLLLGFLPLAYKVLTGILYGRLKPLDKTLMGSYEFAFRPGKSTIKQDFTLRQILEKSHENQVVTNHIFVDYKAAIDSPIRDRVFAAMSGLGIPAQLIKLSIMYKFLNDMDVVQRINIHLLRWLGHEGGCMEEEKPAGGGCSCEHYCSRCLENFIATSFLFVYCVSFILILMLLLVYL